MLDLGCGTCALATDLGVARHVTGVDPAAAMLDLARARDPAKAVTWVRADATTLRLGRAFDLVLLSGQAVQIFPSRDQQLALLATIAAHLTPSGRFVFDTRNPAFPDPKERTQAQTQHRIEQLQFLGQSIRGTSRD